MEDLSLNSGHSPLDEAYRLASDGDKEGAARQAIGVLEANPRELGAVALILELLGDLGVQAWSPRDVGHKLVAASIRRGDLPGAVHAIFALRQLGHDPATLIRAVATAFAKGSPRLGGGAGAPPPLPKPPVEDPSLDLATGEALLDRAREALADWVEWEDPISDAVKLPRAPLFSAMGQTSLERLLASLEVRDVPTGDRLITQGEEGAEAFVVVRGMLVAYREGAEGTQRLAAFGPGAIFGEMALVSDAPRAASVEAVEGSRVLVMARDILEREGAREPAIGRELGAFCRDRMVSNLLRHSPILGAVEPGERAALVDSFSTEHFEPGQVLVSADAEARGLFLIASGQVAVEGTDSDDERIRLAELGPGDVVGEISLVLRRPATATVVATHPTVALVLPREGFQRTIKEHPALLAELYELATKRDDETQSVVGQQALDLDDVCLL